MQIAELREPEFGIVERVWPKGGGEPSGEPTPEPTGEPTPEPSGELGGEPTQERTP